jgi:hypothetical protein
MNMRLTALVVTAIVFSILSGYGMYSLNAMGLVTPPTPLSAEAKVCEAKGRQNAMYPDVYELLRTQGGCDMLDPYSKAYPMAPVPLKLESGASNTQGKP